jgi:hypothetical protein
MEEVVAMDAGNEDIGMTVVVIISNRDTDVETAATQAGLLGHICEYTIAIIAEKPVTELAIILFQRGDIRAVGEENVRPTIAVVIKDGYAARHTFG